MRRSSSLSIVEIMTRGDVHRKSCVDYVIGVLLHGNMETIRAIIQQKVVHPGSRLLLEKRLTAVMKYVRFLYFNHIGKYDDPSHDRYFSLLITRKTLVGISCPILRYV